MPLTVYKPKTEWFEVYFKTYNDTHYRSLLEVALIGRKICRRLLITLLLLYYGVYLLVNSKKRSIETRNKAQSRPT